MIHHWCPRYYARVSGRAKWWDSRGTPALEKQTVVDAPFDNFELRMYIVVDDFYTETVVGTISPVTAISPRRASAIMHNHSESSQAQIDLTAALDESFEKKSMFNDQYKTQLLDLCPQYRSVFSLT